jgi:lysophospholipid acyltransferase (LPLAT)-like uncharacterized protein
MSDETEQQSPADVSQAATRQRPKAVFGSRRWRREKAKAVQSSEWFLNAACLTASAILTGTHWLNRDVSPDADLRGRVQREGPLIIAMWHGRHFPIPLAWPDGEPLDAMLSRSTDAEINARFIARFGIGTIRGSGGRDDRQKVERSLEKGRNVAMIADISHAAAKQAGEGVVMLARISGRPIVPAAYATSRRIVFKDSWDQAHLNLPFGKRALVAGPPIVIAADDDVEEARRRVTQALNDVTTEADRLVGARR